MEPHPHLPFPWSHYNAAELKEISKALIELSAALGHPAMIAAGDQTVESELIRFATQRLKEK